MGVYVPKHTKNMPVTPTQGTAKTDKGPSVGFGGAAPGVDQGNNGGPVGSPNAAHSIAPQQPFVQAASILRFTPAAAGVPPLPERIKRLVAAACAGMLPGGAVQLGCGLVTDVNTHVLGWAGAYLVGDRDHALSHLSDAAAWWESVAC